MHDMFLAALTVLAASLGATAVPPSGGGVVGDGEFADAISAATSARMQADTAANVNALRRAGLLALPKAQAAANDLQWPLRAVAGFDQFGYHGTKNFVDHDARFPGFVQDYTCGNRTYDLAAGYNHAGTDYFLWPFPWLMMDQGQVMIVAAAPGVIANKDDGNFDRNCAIGSTGNPNFVSVLQDDGLTAFYLHMRSGSVTTLRVGERVAAGDYLGTVGSSGSSSGPHLHFELQDASGNIVDPRQGQCNAAPDLWAVFQAYEDPHIDSLSTHSAEPDQIVCGSVGGETFDDMPHYKDLFSAGDVLWVFASYRDQRDGEVTNYSILRPDGSAFAQWDFDLAGENLGSPYYSGTAWDWMFALPASAPPGVWQVRALFQGQTYAHDFVVGDPNGLGATSPLQAREQNAANATRCRPHVGDALPNTCTP